MNSIRIGEKRASALDDMLRDCDNKDSYHHYSELNSIKYEELLITAHILEELRYIEIKVDQDFQLLAVITDRGRAFIRDDSFMSRIEDEAEKQRKESEKESQDCELRLKQIRALKQKPYLIAWNILVSIISIILAYLQLRQ